MASNEDVSTSDIDEDVASVSLKCAENCLERCHYGRAFSHYLVVLQLHPAKKPDIKESFSLSLREWGEQLERQGRIEELFKCYEQACELFPECETMLNNMGAQLFRLGYIDEAACFLRRSLKLDPFYLGARENLENVCGHLVERWHFRMLNDRVRNEAYRGAIIAAVSSGYDSVLDIGTGTGLLSMFAVEAGAKSVYGCDMSKTMFEMSSDVIYTNQMADQINLIHSKSTDLKIPEQIPERVSLVVTEVFDAGLLGEGVIHTLYHAWKNLLQPRPLARVIPQGATLYICAVESDYIRCQNRFLYPGLQHLDFKDINIACKTGHNHICAEFEPYTSEWLDQVPGGCRLLTLPVPFMDIDLSDPQSMEKFLVGFTQEFSLTVSENGRLDAVVTWFDLHLDSDHSITSAPGSGSCWEQGIYPILQSQLDTDKQSDNLFVKGKDSLLLKCFYRSDSIKFKCTKIIRNLTESNMGVKIKGNNCNNDLKLNSTHSLKSVEANLSVESNTKSMSGIQDLPISQNCAPHLPLKFNHELACSAVSLLPSNNNRLCNVLVEPIQQSGSSNFFNGNYGELDFGLSDINGRNFGENVTTISSREMAQENLGGDSIEEQHLHLENQCIEIIESVINCDDPPPIHCTTVGHLNGNHPDQCLDLNSGHTDNHSRHYNTETGGITLDDSDVNLASISIQNLSFNNGGSSDVSLTDEANCPSNSLQLADTSGEEVSTKYQDDNLDATVITQYDSCNSSTSTTEAKNGDTIDNESDSASLQYIIPQQAFYLSREEIFKLNDLHYNRSLCTALKDIKSRVEPSNFRVVTYIDGVPMVALQALKIGAKEVCLLDCDAHQPLVHAIADVNDIPINKLIFTGTEELEMFDNDWGVLLAELVDESGCLQQRILEDVALARATCLSANAIVVPGNVTVQAMLIESHSLRIDSMVTSDNNTLGYMVAGFMNDFQMTTHPGINLSVLEHKVLTHPFELFSFDLNEFNLGEVPSYLDQSGRVEVTAVDTGTVHAILYWFDLQLTPKIKVSTMDSKYHWKQAAILQKCPLTVSTGSPLRIDSMCRNSCIHADLFMNA